MTWWAHSAYQSGGIVALFSWIFWVIFSIVLHELAHGWAALANGDRTPRELGHMTPNPVVHMGWYSLLMFAVIGIAWGQMPTNPSRYRHPRRGRVLVSAAGPAMNLLLALLTLTGLGTWVWAAATQRLTADPETVENVATFLRLGGFLNLLLAAFNLLPVPPLDGSRILSGASLRLDAFFMQPAVQMYGLIAVMLLFFSSVGDRMSAQLALWSIEYAVWVAGELLARWPGVSQ